MTKLRAAKEVIEAAGSAWRCGAAVTLRGARCAHHARFGTMGMQRYANLAGDSGVAAYECRPGEIRLRFVDRATVYVYTRKHPGARHVREMQRLAAMGRGLATYVNRHVRDNYEYTIE